jgi:formamidopyrimidine-DNA glycosylase
MPELPEVEVVRRGLEDHVVGREIADVEIYSARATRRHLPGPLDLTARLRGQRVADARRRGKYLWLVLPDHRALVVHLGMSGQLLVERPDAMDERHLRARFTFADEGSELRFVDQRTFGGLLLADLDADGIPGPIAHIARDLLDPDLDQPAVVRQIHTRQSAIKRVLLDQQMVSGIGNIYADEALWRAGIHGERLASRLTGSSVSRLLDHTRDVMVAALDQGGTSFDSLYVNINGASGYFDRSLHAYGREGQPCSRCGTLIQRRAFMNRSSFFCPRCQPPPRPVTR